ncbi:MAG: glycosyl transferase, partial [Pseudomonadota bacterium]|nr:glycosyl transferase [Pseudomonadota bacterium]
IPHNILLYTGPFCPQDITDQLHDLAAGQDNIRVEKFTPDLHQEIAGAALSISMGGYNTSMNVLATGVRSMMMGCANNGGMDQVERVEKLGQLGIVDVIHPGDLEPAVFAKKITRCLERVPVQATIDLAGVATTRHRLRQFINSSENHISTEVRISI